MPIYYTGRPCKYGHAEGRYISTRNCVVCNKLRGRKENCTDAQMEIRREIARRSYQNNHERAREINRLAVKEWAERNPEKSRAKVRKYQAAKLQRVPAWADIKAIERFYEACPEGFEVDHFYPLQGKTVSGLHVLENLQYLEPIANKKKGNRI